jgi:DNA-binding HxlR family transcriptional regulator
MSKLKKEYSCSLLLTIDLIGGKWKLRILWHIMKGDNRYSLLQKAIPEITQKMLTTQLKELEDSELIIRKVVKEKPLNVQYSLSDKYAQMETIIDSLCDFSKEYGKMNGIIVYD